MTTEELRALDAEIHTKVFGFTDIRKLPVSHGQDGCTLVGGDDLRGCPLDWCYLPKYEHDAKDDIFCEVVPHYSTDIKAAWLVVEKLKTRTPFRDWRVEATAMTGKHGQPLNLCRIHWTGDLDDDIPVASSYPDTAPLAICRAALKAIDAAALEELAK